MKSKKGGEIDLLNKNGNTVRICMFKKGSQFYSEIINYGADMKNIYILDKIIKILLKKMVLLYNYQDDISNCKENTDTN